MTLSVSSLGKKTQTQRRSCMVLLLWKVSLFIFVLLRQDRPLYRGSGSSDDPPPPPQTPLPPVTVSLLQLQPSTDTPAPSGSAGQAALTRQSMGARAAVSHCGDTSENMKDSMLAQQLISFLCMNYVDVFCSMRNGCVVDLKMMNLFEYLNIKIANLQKNMFPLKESDRRGEIKGRQTKKKEGSTPVCVHEYVTSFQGNVNDSRGTCEHLSKEELMKCNDGMKETPETEWLIPKKRLISITFSFKTQQNQFWALTLGNF